MAKNEIAEKKEHALTVAMSFEEDAAVGGLTTWVRKILHCPSCVC